MSTAIRLIACLLLLLGLIQPAIAHEPNEAFFVIKQQENSLQVEAELPWTIRDALLTYNPSLEKATSKEEFETAFFAYVQANLILKDKNGTPLNLQTIQELPQDGHAHQTKYLLIYEGNTLTYITNTILFQEFDNQENFHSLFLDNKKWQYTTHPEAATFLIGQTESPLSKNSFLWKFGLGIVILIGYLILKKIKHFQS